MTTLLIKCGLLLVPSLLCSKTWMIQERLVNFFHLFASERLGERFCEADSLLVNYTEEHFRLLYNVPCKDLFASERLGERFCEPDSLLVNYTEEYFRLLYIIPCRVT